MRALAASALAWIDERRDAFRLATPSIPGVKRLGELGIMAGVVEPAGGERMAWAWEQLGRGDAIAALVPAQPAIGCVYVPFRRAGLRSPAVERALADPASHRGVRDAHWFLRLAVGTALAAIGIAPPWRTSLRDAFPMRADPLQAEMAAHVVMWRTAMGGDRAGLADDDRRRLAAALPTWASQLAAAGEWDALAEILAAAACADLPQPEPAWRALAAAQRDDGTLPLRRGTGHDFDGCYHTTLVLVIAAALADQVPARRAVAARRAAEAWGAYAD